MNLDQLEREKYERIWQDPDYHKHSPGERLVPYFVKNVPFEPGQSLIDLGCGTGRAGAELTRHGLNVTLLDHVTAVDSNIELPFISANLWQLPDMPSFDWFYCCDVMEHIPEEMVNLVLDQIAFTSTRGGFFQIAQFPNEWHGETLHLTVKPTDWWVSKLEERWNKLDVTSVEDQRLVAIVQGPIDNESLTQ